MKTEKITINLSPTEIGQIDYLVERGLYTNRSDFIRLAVRKQTEAHAGDIDQFLTPVLPKSTAVQYHGGLGILRFSQADMARWLEAGAKLQIRVVGALIISKRITASQIAQTVTSIKVYGKIFAEESVKQALQAVME